MRTKIYCIKAINQLGETDLLKKNYTNYLPYFIRRTDGLKQFEKAITSIHFKVDHELENSMVAEKSVKPKDSTKFKMSLITPTPKSDLEYDFHKDNCNLTLWIDETFLIQSLRDNLTKQNESFEILIAKGITLQVEASFKVNLDKVKESIINEYIYNQTRDGLNNYAKLAELASDCERMNKSEIESITEIKDERYSNYLVKFSKLADALDIYQSEFRKTLEKYPALESIIKTVEIK
jgi:hypothetical protein